VSKQKVIDEVLWFFMFKLLGTNKDVSILVGRVTVIGVVTCELLYTHD